MICYKDRTYCSRECGNNECSRNITDEVRDDAAKWSSPSESAIISIADLKTDTCGYIKNPRDS